MNKELIEKDLVVKEFLEYFENNKIYTDLKLVGGAVVDLLDGKKPKDYDFTNTSSTYFFKALKELGYIWQYETKTASTYKKENSVVQILKTDIKDFEFKISQSYYNLKNKTLNVDEISFNRKVLIPVSFDNKGKCINCLKRKIHWEKKGYTMPDETYLSLCNALYNNRMNNS